jgi:hypothetical protein
MSKAPWFLAAPLLVLLMVTVPLVSQELYWEYPSTLSKAEAWHLRFESGSDFLAAFWQEYEDDGKIKIVMSRSFDGKNWEKPKTIVGPLDYYWQDKVALFSINIGAQDKISLSLITGVAEVSVYQSVDKGSTFTRDSIISTPTAAMAPRLYSRKDGSLILFITRSLDEASEFKPLSIFLSESKDGKTWSEPVHFINNPELIHNFLPVYLDAGTREIVVFQSRVTRNERTNYQLFSKTRAGNAPWSEETLLTDMPGRAAGQTQPYYLLDNQRPCLSVKKDGTILLTWERKFLAQQTQIILADINIGGKPENIRVLSEPNRMSYFPKILQTSDDRTFVTWFDDRAGNQIILAEDRGSYVDQRIISSAPGTSFFAWPILYRGSPYIAWENRYRDKASILVLTPDTVAAAPRISPVNFIPGERSGDDTAVLTWDFPSDSSGIQGFSYVWDRSPDTVPPREENRRIPQNRKLFLLADDDGVWYFHLASLDKAGNWSDTVHFPFTRDRTPPNLKNKRIITPGLDEMGYLLANTFGLTWEIPDDPDIEGYSWRMEYLGTDYSLFFEGDTPEVKPPEKSIMVRDREVFFNNIDNGIWGFSLSAIDKTGNFSPPLTVFLFVNKYKPVTYISFVEAIKDQAEQLTLLISGRGFSEQGTVSSVIVDRDREQPWDYEFFRRDGDFEILSDRKIRGPLLDEVNAGTYYIGVSHPSRGLAFYKYQLKLEPSGSVKFGNFEYTYSPLWEPVRKAIFLLPVSRIFVFAVLLLLLFFSILSVIRLYSITGEAAVLANDARAAITGDLMSADLRQERIRTMKKRGMSLRIKFILALLSLVVSIVLMVSTTFGFYMITTQTRSMANDLVARTSLLLETAAASGREYLPTKNSLALLVMPDQIKTITEARSMTITGSGQNDPTQYAYIWGSNDPDIDSKQSPIPSFPVRIFEDEILAGLEEQEKADLLNTYGLKDQEYVLKQDLELHAYRQAVAILISAGVMNPIIRGITLIDDEIETPAQALEDEVNTRGREEVGSLIVEKQRLDREIQVLVERRDEEGISQLQNTISRIDEEINAKLQEIAALESLKFGSYPPFDTERFIDDETIYYTFYKPIIYSEVSNDRFYKGLVRITITTEYIKQEIAQIRRRIFLFTLGAIGLAMILAMTGALLLSSLMISPIKKLVAGVEIIRDTPNKEKLKGHVINVKTRDELSQLADTINQMTYGLVKAAEANKDLIMGKEIQKMFIPLERTSTGDRKMTTGRVETPDAIFFGYYEGAKGVSGDYFDFRQLDDNHFALIKCDISGKGIPASLIMVEVATIFINYFRNINIARQGIHIDRLLYNINDLLTEVGFKGRFAALIVAVVEIKTGKCWLGNAGDNIVHYYDNKARKMKSKTINQVPAAGVFPSDMITGDRGYKQVLHQLDQGDILFLFTDGIEEAQRRFRNEKFETILCDSTCGNDKEGNPGLVNHNPGTEFEELGIPRIQKVVEAVMDHGRFTLDKYHNPEKDKPLTFDFTSCEGTVEETILAMVAVEKVFRLIPDPKSGPEDRIQLDNKIDDFLKKHFEQYREYFRFSQSNDDYPEYTWYTHLKEDEQFDDLTILAVRKK